MDKQTKKHYTSTGLVYGNFWGGGRGSYPSRKLSGNSEDEIMEKVIEGIKDGSLDSGMGFESLIGGLIHITEHETIEVDGKEYVRKTVITNFVGDLSEEEVDFLVECSLGH